MASGQILSGSHLSWNEPHSSILVCIDQSTSRRLLVPAEVGGEESATRPLSATGFGFESVMADATFQIIDYFPLSVNDILVSSHEPPPRLSLETGGPHSSWFIHGGALACCSQSPSVTVISEENDLGSNQVR
ncbi:hypothetical protein RRG08_060645 [Elysia crispata]|uniref:Uncharacterized protein n=1 Tax=Elysia crispata TaxID=231223 RepID=A0AAE1ARY6_9GAST|nr:hypothetical protein RRG08_060645 [Elysia crispata]